MTTKQNQPSTIRRPETEQERSARLRQTIQRLSGIRTALSVWEYKAACASSDLFHGADVNLTTLFDQFESIARTVQAVREETKQ